jgi:archaellum biogenesis ATPase FlaH
MTESYVVRKEACPRCTEKGRDTSKNNLAIYSNGGQYCWSADCDYRVISADYLKDEIIELPIYESDNLSSFTKDNWNDLKKQTSTNPRGYRGLTQNTCDVYHVYHQFNEETGQVVKQFYPLSSATDFCGMKVKVAEPKNFYAEGSNKIDTTELFGQSVFKKSLAKSILITEGELDALSAYQMLLPLAKDYPPTPCVSSTVGSGGYKQFKHQYEYLNRFDRIILCVDQDKAGQASIPNIISVLPKGKVLVMEFSKKDANKMLTENLEKEFINAFFKAKPYNPNGIRGSSGLYDEIIKDIQTPKLPFPPFMHKIQEMLCGGLKVGSIMNLGAASGCGKTTFVNEMIYYWIFNSPYKVGIISMELDSGQYGGALVSRHLSKKLNLFVNPDDAVAYLQQPDVVAAIQTLHTTPDGQDRFHLIEERDGDVERMKELIQQLIIQCDCKVIIIDPLQDLMAGMSNDAQEVFLKWMKEMIKSFGIIFININHVRKSPTGKESNSAGAFITEEDFAGSSTIFKSASFNLLFTRNKYSDDPIEKNKTCMYASKNRQTGITGDAGCFFYENSTHTLHDFEVYMTEHPELFVTSDYD